MRRDFYLSAAQPLPWVSLLGPSGAIPKWLLCPAAYSSIAKGGPEFKAHLRAQRLHADRTLTNRNDCNGRPRLPNLGVWSSKSLSRAKDPTNSAAWGGRDSR